MGHRRNRSSNIHHPPKLNNKHHTSPDWIPAPSPQIEQQEPHPPRFMIETTTHSFRSASAEPQVENNQHHTPRLNNVLGKSSLFFRNTNFVFVTQAPDYIQFSLATKNDSPNSCYKIVPHRLSLHLCPSPSSFSGQLRSPISCPLLSHVKHSSSALLWAYVQRVPRRQFS